MKKLTSLLLTTALIAGYFSVLVSPISAISPGFETSIVSRGQVAAPYSDPAALAENPDGGFSISTGLVNVFGGAGGVISGESPLTNENMTQYEIIATKPEAAQCVAIEFDFISSEFPAFYGTGFNDSFLIEMLNETADSELIYIPEEVNLASESNIAFDSEGRAIKLNSFPEDAYTIFESNDRENGRIDNIRALGDLGSITTDNVKFIFTIADIADSFFNTQVDVNNIIWTTGEDCDVAVEIDPEEEIEDVTEEPVDPTEPTDPEDPTDPIVIEVPEEPNPVTPVEDVDADTNSDDGSATDLEVTEPTAIEFPSAIPNTIAQDLTNSQNSSGDQEEKGSGVNANGIYDPGRCSVTGILSGNVYFDADQNNARNNGDFGYEDIRVQVYYYDAEGERQLIIFEEGRDFTTRTDKEGDWEVELCIGDYEVEIIEIDLPAGVERTSAEMLELTLPEEGNENGIFVIDEVEAPEQIEESAAGFNWLLCCIPLAILLLGVLVFAYFRNREESEKNKSKN